jgi:hypothetical protein
MSQEEGNSLIAMSQQEKAELLSLEAVIEEGLEIFRKVGTALLRIRDGKLYREGYKTFYEYCEKRWNVKKSHAYELMDAAQIATNIENSSAPADKILPQNEFQLRPLTQILPEDQPKVWDAAVESANGQQPSFEQVQATIEKEVPPERRVDRRPKSKAEKLAEKIGMRIAFDGSMVPKDFSDDDRRKAIAELNEVRAKREAGRRAVHGPLNVFPDEKQAAKLQAQEAATHQSPSSHKDKEPSIESRFRNFARAELMDVFRRYFRKDEYVRVYKLLGLAINKTAIKGDSSPTARSTESEETTNG